MKKGVSFSDILIHIARQYEENNHKYTKEIISQMSLIKNEQLLPSKLNRDDILIASWAWKKVSVDSTVKFEPIRLLNEVYKCPSKTIRHLGNILNLIRYSIMDSQIKKVTSNSQNRVVRMDIEKDMLLETEVFFTKEFIQGLLCGKKNAMKSLSGYGNNKEFMDDWFAYVSAAQEVAWTRFRVGLGEMLAEELYCMARAWQTIVKRMSRTRRVFPLLQLTNQYHLDHREQIVIMNLLKDELEGETSKVEDIKRVISQNRYEMLKNQAYFEDSSKLVTNAIIESESVAGFKSPTEIRLCSDIISKLMDERSIDPKNQIKEMLKGNDIFSYQEPEQEFANLILEKEKKDILLNGINQYQNNITDTLINWGIYDSKQAGNNSGLLVLLYGPPGTGKTYCAHAIAHYLEKPLLTTDISKLLSCWVGESEQNVRRLFSTYEKIHKRIKNSPVLLLNEADQFLTKRGEANRSVDRMYNQMQNLFLEAFENFKGILVCTTNLRDNLDPAFSRRFHLKLEFPLPKFEEREKLWKLHLPDTIPGVAEIDINSLAKRYELSGGQISVVVKNAATESAGRPIKERVLVQGDLEKYCILEMETTFGCDKKKYGFIN